MSQAYNESLRPQFHFTAKTNWLNDPNGLVYYKGIYHLFFQYNPESVNWGNMSWGHATSPDLVHWSQQTHAILPDDSGTIFSGSAVVDWRNTSGFQQGTDPPLVAIYTCAGDTSPASLGKPFTQCLAFSCDAGMTWQKYPGNPVMDQIAPGNRDPKVIWFEPTQSWVMALYLENSDFGIYVSPDLKDWSPTQRFTFEGVSECPDFFELAVVGSHERKWVFTSASGHYLVGAFDGKSFHPEQGQRQMDLGPNFYAVQTFSDLPGDRGRRVQIAWMRGGSYPEMPFNQQMSFPCELTLHQVGSEFVIHRSPVVEVAGLASGNCVQWTELQFEFEQNLFASLKGDLWALDFDFEFQTEVQIEFLIRGCTIILDSTTQQITVDNNTVGLAMHESRLQLRILVDRTSIEIFSNKAAFSYTKCFVPACDSIDLSLVVIKGEALLRNCKVQGLQSIWSIE